MSGIERHLLEDEPVAGSFEGQEWSWLVTDNRLMKHRSGPHGSEEFYDVSLEEISGVGLLNKGRDRGYLMACIVSVIMAVIFLFLAILDSILISVTLLLAVAAVIFYIVYLNSAEARFQFRGPGLLSKESDAWRIKTTDVDEREFTDFVKTVREQL